MRDDSPQRKRKRRHGLMLKCIRLPDGVGAFVPSDRYTQERLRKRRVTAGKHYAADLRESRNPAFFRKAHALATLVIENIPDFEMFVAHQDEHTVLKRLQLDSGLACEELMLDGGLIYKIPLSLAFDEMDEEEFTSLYTGLCAWIGKRYYGDLDASAVDDLAHFAGEAG